jgi:hypothetical protein
MTNKGSQPPFAGITKACTKNLGSYPKMKNTSVIPAKAGIQVLKLTGFSFLKLIAE